MAHIVYPKGMEGLLDGTISLPASSIKAALVRGYIYSTSHSTLADITTAGGTIVAVTGALGSKTYTGGVFNAADDTFGSVSAGAAVTSVILHQATGSNSTSRLLFYADDFLGLPYTPDGNPIPIVWNASGIFAVTSG